MNNFAKQLNELIEELGLSNVDVARLCRVSLGTVRRWRADESAPHPLGQSSVFRTLQNMRKPKQ